MNILITGAHGFVGQRLCQKLAQKDHHIWALVRTPEQAQNPVFQDTRISVIIQDLKNLSIETLPQNIDILYSLAQSSHFRDFPHNATDITHVNILAPVQLWQWAATQNISTIIHTSSGGVFPSSLSHTPSLKDPVSIDSPIGFYLASKLCAEILLNNFSKHIPHISIIRPYFVYGPNQSARMFVMRLVESIKTETPIFLQGDEGFSSNPVFIEDLVEGLILVPSLSGKHTWDCAGPDEVTLKSLCDLIGNLLNKNPVYEKRAGIPQDYVGQTQWAQDLHISLTPLKEGLAQILT
jgi:nucleoside-diphosphate-sugar epimerase